MLAELSRQEEQRGCGAGADGKEALGYTVHGPFGSVDVIFLRNFHIAHSEEGHYFFDDAQAGAPRSRCPSSHTSGTPAVLVTLKSSRHRSRSSTPSPTSRPAPASMRASTSSTRP